MEFQNFHNQDGQIVAAGAVQMGYEIARGSDGAYYVITPSDTLANCEQRTIGDETYEAALNDLFAPYAWPGGYAIAWYNAGDTLCPRCARHEYEADEAIRNAFRAGEWVSQVTNEDDSYHGVECDNCHEWIVAPACVICGNDLVDERANGSWYEPDGDRQVCADCMAAALDAGKDADSTAYWTAVPRENGQVEFQYRHSYEGIFEQ